MMDTIELGDTAIDRISGFEGVVTGRCKYITGCDQFLLSPRVSDDGRLQDARWVDVQRCEKRPSAVRVVLDNRDAHGSDIPAPIR